MTIFDNHANLAYTSVAVAPSPPDSGLTLSVAPGRGVYLPTPPFQATVCAVNEIPTVENSEIIRVLTKVGDDITFERISEEPSVARTILVGDQFMAPVTKKILDDLKAAINVVESLYALLDSPALTGTPTAPTPTSGNNSTRIATTAFVQGAVGSPSIPDPLTVGMIQGGTTTMSALTLKPTSGAAAAGTSGGSDIIFKVGNNGDTEILRVQQDRRLVLSDVAYFSFKTSGGVIDSFAYNGGLNRLAIYPDTQFAGTMYAVGVNVQDLFYTRYLGVSGSTLLTIPANGRLILTNWSENGFDRLHFGGTTTSFPCLKRSGTTLETKLSDDSAYAQHSVSILAVVDGISAPAAQTGKAVIYVDVADGDLKVIFADGTIKTLATNP